MTDTSAASTAANATPFNFNLPADTRICLDVVYFPYHNKGCCDVCNQEAETSQKIVLWHYRPKIRHLSPTDPDYYLYSIDLCDGCYKINRHVMETVGRDPFDAEDGLLMSLRCCRCYNMGCFGRGPEGKCC